VLAAVDATTARTLRKQHDAVTAGPTPHTRTDLDDLTDCLASDLERQGVGGRPGICGAFPARARVSQPFTARQVTRTNTSPGPTSGTGTSSTTRTSGPPWRWYRAARIDCGRPTARPSSAASTFDIFLSLTRARQRPFGAVSARYEDLAYSLYGAFWTVARMRGKPKSASGSVPTPGWFPKTISTLVPGVA
jgi:hypothetical protein